MFVVGGDCEVVDVDVMFVGYCVNLWCFVYYVD